MVAVSLYDEIDIRKIRTASKNPASDELIKISCDHPDVPPAEVNIVYRAAQLILKKSRRAQPISIRIKKKHPGGAGLGRRREAAAPRVGGTDRPFHARPSRCVLQHV